MQTEGEVGIEEDGSSRARVPGAIHFDFLVRFRFLPGKTGKRNRK
jgi:hypothetical protein